MLLTALPLTCLHNLVVSHLRFYHGAAFGNGIPYWFFYIHMFAGFTGMYHLQGMPMIGCANNYGIHIFPIE